MSHSFDTGLAVAQRTLIRRAAVDILSVLKRPNGYLGSVKGFSAVVRSYTDDEGIEWLTKELTPTPSIGVATGSREFKVLGIGGRQALSECELILYFVSQHWRDGLRGRIEPDSVSAVSDSADPGIDTVMEHAIELMHGTYPSALNLTTKQFRIERETELATHGALTIWQQIYRVTMQSYTGSGEFRTPEELITSLHWRTTTNPNEPNRPAPAVDSTTIDADSDP